MNFSVSKFYTATKKFAPFDGNHCIFNVFRTQSMASNNSVIVDGLKRRQNFLQNLEGRKSSQTLTPSSLLQLTPVINV